MYIYASMVGQVNERIEIAKRTQQLSFIVKSTNDKYLK